MLSNNSEAICGNCGGKFCEHFIETQRNGEKIAFCNSETNGDVFTNEPNDSQIVDYLRANRSIFLGIIIERWKEENGHCVKAE